MSADLQLFWITHAYLNTEQILLSMLLKVGCNQCESEAAADMSYCAPAELKGLLRGRGLTGRCADLEALYLLIFVF